MPASGVAWDDDATVAAWPGCAPLDGDVTADACVVGLGATGLTAVAELAGRGLSVIGVDAGRIADGAAGRNGGFLLGGPALFLHDAIGRWGVEAAVGIYGATLAELDQLTRELGPDVVRPTGSIRLAGLPGAPRDEAEIDDRAAEVADCARHADALRAHGIDVLPYEGPLGSGLLLPDDCATNPALRAVRAAARVSQLPGVRLHENTRVTALAGRAVQTGGGRITAAVVIVAIDGRLEVLLPQLAGRVRTARLQMLATAPLPELRLPCPVYGRWGYDYAQQSGDGRLFVGGGRDLVVDDEWTTSAEPTAAVQDYIEQVATRMAGGPVTVTHRWAASVGYTPDGRPLCLAVQDGVVAVGGYNGTGNLVGPVAARAAVALALDGTTAPSYFSSASCAS